MTELLAAGFTDSFRYLHPDVTGAYSWWSMRFKARERNAGWRIDYYVVSERLKDALQDAKSTVTLWGRTTALWNWILLCKIKRIFHWIRRCMVYVAYWMETNL